MDDSNPLGRRQFLRFGLREAARAPAEILMNRAKKIAPSIYVRPPGALEELQFVTTCKRCGDCASACPEKIIEQLGTETGSSAMTPHLVFEKSFCRFCEDMPCVSACSSGALVKQETFRLGVAKIEDSRCFAALGQHCDYCVNTCRRATGAISMSGISTPEIDTELCNGCGRCEQICPASNSPAIRVVPSETKQ